MVIEAQKKREAQNEKQDSDDDVNEDADCFKGTSVKPISIENELKAWELCKNLCEVQLNIYPTTLEEDKKMLED